MSKPNAETTTSFAKAKGVPLKDSKKPFSIVITDEALTNGRRKRPEACAAAYQIFNLSSDSVKEQLGVGGRLFAVAVRKSSTILGFMKSGGKLQALRFQHSNGVQREITGFDNEGETFEAGETVTFYPPVGKRRLGGNPSKSPDTVRRIHGPAKTKCERRVVGDPYIA